MMIDWTVKEGAVLVNPRLPPRQQALANSYLGRNSPWPGHIWLATSGTHASSCDEIKWVALSKEAILASAEAVNSHLASTSEDRWLHALPNFHIGGLAIWARGYLSGASVYYFDGRWNPHHYAYKAWRKGITLTSLVPTQLYDLVMANLQAPHSLRAAIIGGGRLDENLYQRAKALGWKPLPSYGMTECCSQVATAPLASIEREKAPSHFLPLSHVALSLNSAGCLLIKSPALLTTYGYVDRHGVRFVDPKAGDGTFCTEDRCQLDEEGLLVIGRESEFVKIAGESASLSQLNALLASIKSEMKLQGQHHLILVEDSRLGHALHLAEAATPQVELQALVDTYNTKVLPPLRIRKTHHLHAIPRNALGKVVTHELKQLCAQGSALQSRH